MALADQLLANFGRIAAVDGSELSLIGADDSVIRMGYKPGTEADCADGVCAVPHAEIEEMMRSWLARKDPAIALEVRLLEN